MQFWLGGYDSDGGGEATGIGVLFTGAAAEQDASAALSFAGDAAQVAGSPSWLTVHPNRTVVYAAMEGAGTVRAFTRTGALTLTALGTPIPVGDGPCHVAVNPDCASLIVSCWNDGAVVRVGLDGYGRMSTPNPATPGTDPYSVESIVAPRPPHAHQAAYLPGGVIATTDMGLDLVLLWRDHPSGLRPVGEVVLPRGCGPRHMVWHPSGHLYVVAELSCELFVLAPDAAGTWRVVGGTPLSPGTLPDDTAAEITLSRHADFVYAGVRGSNTIAVLGVRGAGEQVTPTALVDSAVNSPRNHLVVGDTLLVAGQYSNEVVSSTMDARTGIPGKVRHRTMVPSPACITPAY